MSNETQNSTAHPKYVGGGGLMTILCHVVPADKDVRITKNNTRNIRVVKIPFAFWASGHTMTALLLCFPLFMGPSISTYI
jgi:hypothetical protein